jgi:hypothetical protein
VSCVLSLSASSTASIVAGLSSSGRKSLRQSIARSPDRPWTSQLRRIARKSQEYLEQATVLACPGLIRALARHPGAMASCGHRRRSRTARAVVCVSLQPTVALRSREIEMEAPTSRDRWEMVVGISRDWVAEDDRHGRTKLGLFKGESSQVLPASTERVRRCSPLSSVQLRIHFSLLQEGPLHRTASSCNPLMNNGTFILGRGGCDSGVQP